MPEAGPLGETFFEARLRAIWAADLLKSPAGGWVESVVTLADHFRFVGFRGDCLAMLQKMREFLGVLVAKKIVPQEIGTTELANLTVLMRFRGQVREGISRPVYSKETPKFLHSVERLNQR